MTAARLAAASAALLLAGGCVRAYVPPKPGEPAALLKVRLAYDHATARAQYPSGSHGRMMVAQVYVVDAKGRRSALVGKTFGDPLEVAEPIPLDTLTATVHPAEELLLDVRFSVAWKTTQNEQVTETRQVPRQVTRMESTYDSTTRSTRLQNVTRTEYTTETKYVTKAVTRDHDFGCIARVRLAPRDGATYLVDYANLSVASGCTATPFLQVGQPDGSFTLQRL